MAEPSADRPTVTRTCSRCGRQGEGPPEGTPPAWSLSVEKGRVEYDCPDCVRANLQSIEGRLSRQDWEA